MDQAVRLCEDESRGGDDEWCGEGEGRIGEEIVGGGRGRRPS